MELLKSKVFTNFVSDKSIEKYGWLYDYDFINDDAYSPLKAPENYLRALYNEDANVLTQLFIVMLTVTREMFDFFSEKMSVSEMISASGDDYYQHNPEKDLMFLERCYPDMTMEEQIYFIYPQNGNGCLNECKYLIDNMDWSSSRFSKENLDLLEDILRLEWDEDFYNYFSQKCPISIPIIEKIKISWKNYFSRYEIAQKIIDLLYYYQQKVDEDEITKLCNDGIITLEELKIKVLTYFKPEIRENNLIEFEKYFDYCFEDVFV